METMERNNFETKLLTAIKANLPELEKMCNSLNDMWGCEDYIYRFYHHSFKVYYAQAITESLVKAFKNLLPERPLNEDFEFIIQKGTGFFFETEHNNKWLETTRPMLEALFHAQYFLEMMCKYGKELNEPPETLPSGWAAVLYLYNLR
jgi:hypothetical protein